MNEASSMSGLTTSEDTPNAISSLGLVAGCSLLNWQEFLQQPSYGPDPAPASPSPKRESRRASKTNATSGLSGTDSSASADLQSLLASKLRQRLENRGSTLFKLTWKEKATPLGRRYLEQQVSALRTSAKDSGSWPTPNAGPQNDSDSTWIERREKLKAEHKNGNGFGLTLGMAVSLASWPTPQTVDDNQSRTHDPFNYSVRWAARPNAGTNLAIEAQLNCQKSSWATTTTRDWKDGACAEANVPVNSLLGRQVFLSSWPSPMTGASGNKDYNYSLNTDSYRKTVALCGAEIADSGVEMTPMPPPLTVTASGETLTGSGAETRSSGQLNPGHSRWLMGYPEAWEQCRKNYDGWRKWQDFLNQNYGLLSPSESPVSEDTETPSYLN